MKRKLRPAAWWMLATCLSLTSVLAETPPRSRAGQTLEAPDEELDLGLVYHSEPGVDAQVVVTARAPLQKAVVVNSRVVGYIVAPFELEDAETPILAGAFRIPARMFKSGVESVDRSVHGAQMLDADNHPEMTFRVHKVSDVRLLEAAPKHRSYELTIAGELTVKSTKIPLRLRSKVRFIPFVMTNLARNVGDLAILETSFSVKPADYGWQAPPRLRPLIADELQVDVYLTLNTVSPDKSGDPRNDPKIFIEQQRFLTLLRDFEDPAAAYAHAHAFMKQIWQDSKELERLTRAIVETPGAVRRDYKLALKGAARASRLAEDGNPALLALVARIHHEVGDHAEAVKWQQKAAELIDDTTPAGLAQSIKTDLESYQKEARDGS